MGQVVARSDVSVSTAARAVLSRSSTSPGDGVDEAERDEE